jgi:hypothetical protein
MVMPAYKGLGDVFAGAIDDLMNGIRRNVRNEFDSALYTLFNQNV